MDIEEHVGCQLTDIFNMYGFSTPAKASVAELKLDEIDPIIL